MKFYRNLQNLVRSEMGGGPRSAAYFPYSHSGDPELRKLISDLFKNIDRSKHIEIVVYYTVLEYVIAVANELAPKSDCFDAFLYNESENYYYILSRSSYSKFLSLEQLLNLFQEILIVPAEISGYDGRLTPTHFKEPLEHITINHEYAAFPKYLNKQIKMLRKEEVIKTLSYYDKKPNIVFRVKVRKEEDNGELGWLVSKTKKNSNPIAYRYGFAPDAAKSIYKL